MCTRTDSNEEGNVVIKAAMDAEEAEMSKSSEHRQPVFRPVLLHPRPQDVGPVEDAEVGAALDLVGALTLHLGRITNDITLTPHWF